MEKLHNSGRGTTERNENLKQQYGACSIKPQDQRQWYLKVSTQSTALECFYFRSTPKQYVHGVAFVLLEATVKPCYWIL